MNAITIIQPFAHLIILPESHPQHKRAENRTWAAPKSSVGKPIAIHAGMGRKYDGTPIEEFAKAAGIPMDVLTFGAVLCVADLIGVVKVHQYSQSCRIHLVSGTWPTKLVHHKHIMGPYAWLLDNIRVLPQPLPWNGAQGLWQINDGIIARSLCPNSSTSTVGETTPSVPPTTDGPAASLFEEASTPLSSSSPTMESGRSPADTR